MTITLPRLHRNTAYVMKPVRRAEVLRAASGGARLPISRPGDHWSAEVDVGVLSTVCGRELIADVLRGAGETVRVPIPQPGIDPGAPGSVRIKGAGQSGTEVEMDGFTPYFALRKGWFLTIETSGAERAYLVCEEVIADAAGEATVTLWPMLHVQPADNDTVEIAEPYLVGLIDEGGDHESGLLPAVTLDSFTVEEES